MPKPAHTPRAAPRVLVMTSTIVACREGSVVWYSSTALLIRKPAATHH